MHERLAAIAKVLAIALTAMVGIGLLAVTPLLLFFGGWPARTADLSRAVSRSS
jgi:uncharacterized membrane protein YfcA